MGSYKIAPHDKKSVEFISKGSIEALLAMFFVVYDNDTAREIQNRTPGMVQNDLGFRLVHIRYSRIGHAIRNEQRFVPANRGGTEVFDEAGNLKQEIIEDLQKAVKIYHKQIEAWAERTGWSYEIK